MDIVAGGCVEGPPQSSPPTSPAIGAAYLIGPGATGAWSGKADCIAAWTSGGWRFVAPTDGLQLLDRSNQTVSVYRSGAWDLGTVRASSVTIGETQVVGPRQPSIAAPSGGPVIDTEARATVAAILAAMQAHGLIG